MRTIAQSEPRSAFRIWPLLGMLAFLGGWLAGLVGVPLTAGTLILHGIVAAVLGALVLMVLLRISHRRMVHT